MTEQVEGILVNLPYQVQQMLEGWSDIQTMAYVFALYIFAPFFLIIPLMASSVIASDSFAGEKERKTIEALLATPLSDSELLLGKILVAFIPSMMVTIGAFLAYTVIVDILSYSLFDGQLWLPNMLWIISMFGLAPVIALTGIGLTVLISARVKGFREAQQISAVLLVPVLALVFGQITGALIFGPLVVVGLMGLFVVIDIIIFRMSVRLFKREEILIKLS